MTYAFLVEWMSAEAREAFDRELPLPPAPTRAARASGPVGASQGTEGLMAAFGMQG